MAQTHKSSRAADRTQNGQSPASLAHVNVSRKKATAKPSMSFLEDGSPPTRRSAIVQECRSGGQGAAEGGCPSPPAGVRSHSVSTGADVAPCRFIAE